MMLWHITIWFMASMQFFSISFSQVPPQKERQAGHFIDLRYFIVSGKRWPCGPLSKRRPRLGLWGSRSQCTSGQLLLSCWPLAWPRPIGHCQAAACHPAILKASQLASLPAAYLECLLAYSNCRLQYLIGFKWKDVPGRDFDQIQKDTLLLRKWK